MDLRKFYLANITEDNYYFKFYDLIKNVNRTYNIFAGYEEKQTNNEFICYDVRDIIDKFRSLCMPENENHSSEDKCWFYIILFYLHKGGYIIEEFPRIIDCPPIDSYQFVNKDIRNKLISEGKYYNGQVKYKDRRELVSNFTFNKKKEYINIDKDIEENFQKISNRQAEFNDMSVDEKLSEIVNSIEFYLKKGGKFKNLVYEKICFDYISDESITKYRKQMQCFRHSTEQALEERKGYTEFQKDFMIDYGLVILKIIHKLLKEEK